MVLFRSKPVVASGSYENLGSAHTIVGGSEPNTNVTSSFNAATFEALSSGISDGESYFI